MLKENNKVIGEIDAMPENPAPDDKNGVLDTFSPCWMLNTNYHGKGYAMRLQKHFLIICFMKKVQEECSFYSTSGGLLFSMSVFHGLVHTTGL